MKEDMAKKTYINLAGEAFVAELQDGSVCSRNGFGDGLLFIIQNKKGETMGCLSVFLPMLTKAVWSNQTKLTPEIVENLFLRVLPHVPFAANISDFSSIYPKCIQLVLDTMDTSYDVEHKVQYVRGRENPQELVNQLVFDGEVNEEKVQKDILTYLYEVHRENHMAYTHSLEMAKELFVDENIIFRCLNYLHDDGFIEGEKALGAPGFVASMITTAGVRHVKNNFHQIYAGAEVIVMGDYVGNDKITTDIKGDGNQSIVKSTVSNSFNMNLLYQKVDELKELLDKEYTGIDKQVLVEQVEEIKTLAAEKENFSKIRALLGGIMTRTAEFATIGAACLELFKFFAGGS